MVAFQREKKVEQNIGIGQPYYYALINGVTRCRDLSIAFESHQYLLIEIVTVCVSKRKVSN